MVTILFTQRVNIEAEWCLYAPINYTVIGLDNGVSPDRRQAIIWTNTGLLSIAPLGKNFNEIWIEIQKFYWRKCLWKCRLQMATILLRSMC